MAAVIEPDKGYTHEKFRIKRTSKKSDDYIDTKLSVNLLISGDPQMARRQAISFLECIIMELKSSVPN